MLGRVSLVLVGAFEPETLWLNRFEGFDKNCVKPEEGDVDRETAGKGGAFGLSKSVIGSFIKPFVGFCSVHVAQHLPPTRNLQYSLIKYQHCWNPCQK